MSPGKYKLRENNKTPARFLEYHTPESLRKTTRQRTIVRAVQQSPQSSVTRRNPRAYALGVEGLVERSESFYEDGYDEPDNDDSPSYVPMQRNQQIQRERYGTQQTNELSKNLKTNLKKLKNMLKLPKSRRFVYCEFFYSAVDRQILKEENEFSTLMQDTFPNLKTKKLRPSEWREVRRLIGKPRRFSQLFLDDERRALKQKRRHIRQIYQGLMVNLPQDHDLPKQLPRQTIVGVRVFARIRAPKDGIFAGTIDAILNDGYRVTFEKEEMIPPMIVPDHEIMPETTAELLNISYFLESNNVNSKMALSSSLVPRPTFIVDPKQNKVVSMVTGPSQIPTFSFQNRHGSREYPWQKRDDKVGNFPLRMLVIMVKLFKVLDHKRVLVMNLNFMNDVAEQMQMVSDAYPCSFQERYAEILNELDVANRLLESYLNGIGEYNDLLVTNLSDPIPADKPEQLRKYAQAHAMQIVKHCNHAHQMKNPDALSVISKLTSIMLQIRQLGHDKKRNAHYELNVLADSLSQLKASLSPDNVAFFQDCVEVHMKQIFLMTNKRKGL